MSRVTAHINLAALTHNYGVVQNYAPKAHIMAAVKANAYGHGAVKIAQTLAKAGCRAFAVATLEEALELRANGITHTIVLLEGVLNAHELSQASQHQLTLVIHDDYQLKLLSAWQGAPFALWLKLDTGMRRLGLQAHQIAAAETLAQGHHLLGYMTHLASADEPHNPHTQAQLQAFETLTAGKAGARSVCNSAGIMAWHSAYAHDWVRPGLMLYGASPFEDKHTSPLQPVMTLTSQILSIKPCSRGDTIGYGATYVCPQDMRIGVVAVGYADGYPRCLPVGTPILINGITTQLVGRVSMDMITVDLTPIPDATIGDQVTLWGEGLPVERIATYANTIAYEIFCGLTRRVQFEYKTLEA